MLLLLISYAYLDLLRKTTMNFDHLFFYIYAQLFLYLLFLCGTCTVIQVHMYKCIAELTIIFIAFFYINMYDVYVHVHVHVF